MVCFYCFYVAPPRRIQQNYWTRFRGADGLGIDVKARVPVNWKESDFKWKIQLPGIGNSSPVVWGNTIFVTSADDEKDTGYLTAVEGKDGKYWLLKPILLISYWGYTNWVKEVFQLL